jgi:hypothetical protein
MTFHRPLRNRSRLARSPPLPAVAGPRDPSSATSTSPASIRARKRHAKCGTCVGFHAIGPVLSQPPRLDCDRQCCGDAPLLDGPLTGEMAGATSRARHRSDREGGQPDCVVGAPDQLRRVGAPEQAARGLLTASAAFAHGTELRARLGDLAPAPPALRSPRRHPPRASGTCLPGVLRGALRARCARRRTRRAGCPSVGLVARWGAHGPRCGRRAARLHGGAGRRKVRVRPTGKNSKACTAGASQWCT